MPKKKRLFEEIKKPRGTIKINYKVIGRESATLVVFTELLH